MFVFVSSCTGGFEVPFGLSVQCFIVSVWDSEMCGFSVEEGGQMGWRWVVRDGLLGRGIRERTPLGVQGLVGEDASSIANRRPLGLRANGCGSLIMRRCLLLIGNMLRAGSR